MIRQSELQDAARIRVGLIELEKHPSVAHYLAERDRLAKSLDGFRERVKRGETSETGSLSLQIKRSAVIAWGKVLTLLQAIEPVKRAVAGSREAQALLDLVTRQDVTAPFISERVSVDVVGE